MYSKKSMRICQYVKTYNLQVKHLVKVFIDKNVHRMI